MRSFQREESGYALEQSTKPQTLGVALNDSPAGLLAWIVEKFRAWSDCDGHPENVVHPRPAAHQRDDATGCTQTIASSARLYWEHQHHGSGESAPEFVGVPTGVARYPKEVLRFPRSWVERRYNVTHWADMPRGGHFAAMEQPELFVDDLRERSSGRRAAEPPFRCGRRILRAIVGGANFGAPNARQSTPGGLLMGLLDGKVAVITGAGSGMARASVEVFVREGAKVVAGDISGAEKDTAAEVRRGRAARALRRHERSRRRGADARRGRRVRSLRHRVQRRRPRRRRDARRRHRWSTTTG